MDYIAPLFPSYNGSRLLAALMTGVLYGIGYGMIYSRGSSTGGADFLMILLKSRMPHLKTGTISFVLDFGVVVISGLIFGDVDGIIYGLIVNYILSVVLDKMILGMNSGNVALIVTNHGKEICRLIDEVSGRGSTILKAMGGYQGSDKDVVMVAGTSRDVYQIRKAVEKKDPSSFTIIMQSNEVDGEGFHMTRFVGE